MRVSKNRHTYTYIKLFGCACVMSLRPFRVKARCDSRVWKGKVKVKRMKEKRDSSRGCRETHVPSSIPGGIKHENDFRDVESCIMCDFIITLLL